jgi:phage gp29-like protein
MPRSTRARAAVPRARAANDNHPKARLAPWPLVDRFATVFGGGGLSLAQISSAMRAASQGDRQPWIDILDELLEREPHGQAVLCQRILAVAGGRIEIEPARVAPGTAEHDEAVAIAKEVEAYVAGIGGFRRALAWLLWALYFGIAATEIGWERSAGEWCPCALHFIHPRRLSYPDPKTWDLHIVDGGGLAGGTFLRLADYPGKFIVHVPQLRGGYPSREGLGRVLGFWFALKALAVRGGAQTIERFAKPWALAYFATQRDGHPRAATDDDIERADAAVTALGIGSLSSATLPDSVKIVLERIEGGITHKEFIDLCDAQISKCVLGQTLTTEVGPSGSRAVAEIHKEGSRELYRFDAFSLAEDVERDLVRPLVRLNWPSKVHLAPRLLAHVAERPDPDALLDRAVKAAGVGMPIDADELGVRLGLPLIPRDAKNARRLVPVLPVHPDALEGKKAPSTDEPAA